MTGGLYALWIGNTQQDRDSVINYLNNGNIGRSVFYRGISDPSPDLVNQVLANNSGISLIVTNLEFQRGLGQNGPELAGWDFIDLLKRHPQLNDTPVVVYTGNTDPEIVAKTKQRLEGRTSAYFNENLVNLFFRPERQKRHTPSELAHVLSDIASRVKRPSYNVNNLEVSDPHHDLWPGDTLALNRETYDSLRQNGGIQAWIYDPIQEISFPGAIIAHPELRTPAVLILYTKIDHSNPKGRRYLLLTESGEELRLPYRCDWRNTHSYIYGDPATHYNNWRTNLPVLDMPIIGTDTLKQAIATERVYTQNDVPKRLEEAFLNVWGGNLKMFPYSHELP